MTEYLINHSALAYLNQWHVTDRRHMNILLRMDRGASAGARLQALAARYGVARGFAIPTATKEDRATMAPALWEQVASLVKSSTSEANISPIDMVNTLANRLGKVFPGKLSTDEPILLSAATKFLWFSGRLDVRIYDTRAVRALNSWCKINSTRIRRAWRVDGSYADFSNSWRRMYETHAASIREAVAHLDQLFNWSLIPDGEQRKSASAVLGQQWFLDRVFDKYLWTLGAPDESRIGGFV